ncbi:MAG: glycoside hydrolase family 71/99-like protein [Akkermansiaceae bacterium]|nr:glycoside hydrolase family 71/99-like protein [Akkermansiaceae bacterium]
MKPISICNVSLAVALVGVSVLTGGEKQLQESVQVAGLAEPDSPRVDASTLTGKVMCGYQGWFRTPGDGEKLNWKHYRSQTTGMFKPGEAGIEFWPDLTGFGDHERFDTEFRHADGTVAQVFSSAVRDTVVRHFKWMREYGIDGVFVQRFATEVTNPKGGRADNDESRSVTKVLQHCRDGAASHGRTYAVMYDLSNMSAARIAAVKDDWRFLVKELGILKDPAYQKHAGRPVLALWGVGFSKRDYGPAEIEPLMDFLKNDPECGGLTIMLGTPTHWRAGERDAGPFADWEKVYQSADIISPWTVGRFGGIDEAKRYAAGIAKPDLQWCAANHKEYMPVVFPGFSWSNLKKGTNENPDAFIDRLGGKFLWSQYDSLVRGTGATMIYQAMFDELDEGTHIFKSTNNPPTGASRFLTYDGLPTDHYLWLVGEAARRLKGEASFSPEMPARTTPTPKSK